MLRIQSSTLTVASHFPRGLTTLGVSWMHGQFGAVALHRGEVAGSWHAPDPIEDLTRFGELLARAVQQTGFQGNSVHLVLAHPRLAHQLVEIPETTGPALRSVVRRQVERLKVFEDAAAWAFEKSERTTNASNALVHLFPQALLNRLSQAAEKNGLHLVSALPPTAILHAQLARLPLDKSDVALLAADFGGHTTIVVGRRDGPLFLARSLDASRAFGETGLAVDVNRTLVYVLQQYGVSVAGVWLFGSTIAGRIGELRPQIQVPLHPSPEESSPHYWAQESLRIPADLASNLISSEQVRAPQRKALLKLTTVLAVSAVFATLTAAAGFLLLTRAEQRVVERLRFEVAQLQTQHRDFQRLHLDLANREHLIQRVLDDRPGPVPIWFAAYLGEITPPDLALTDLHVARETNAWRVRIGGRCQPTAASTRESLVLSVETMIESLRDGPFQANILGSSDSPSSPPATRSPAVTSAFADWAAQLKPAANANASANAPPPVRDEFAVEALLQ